MNARKTRIGFAAAAVVAALGGTALHATPAARSNPVPPFVGRWDLTVGEGRNAFPSWIEVKLSGFETLVGQYVARGGSARPISHVLWEGNRMHFTVPKQWERGPHDITLEGQLAGDRLTGTLTTENGQKLPWTGVRAPALHRDNEPQWGKTVTLFNGKDLTGWKPRNSSTQNGWVAEGGILRDIKPGNDLVSEAKFKDFKLHAEFRYPKDSNSGIYLRGRYEIQIQDDYGEEPESHLIGGVYGFLTPRVNAARRAGEWQTVDVTFVGRRVTEVLNGEQVLDRQEIPGITGGALDSNEGEPGPLMLQGDHGPVDFRNIRITPAR